MRAASEPRLQRQAVPEFETTAQGCRIASSVGGVLTGRGAAGDARADPQDRSANNPRTLRSGGCRPIPAGSVAIGRRARQGRLVQALHGRGGPAIRAHRAELGHRQQGDRASPHPSLPRTRGREGWGCTIWGISGKDLYLIDVVRRRMEYPELKRAVRVEYERLCPSVVLIEDKASGKQLIQELIADGLYAVTLSAASGQGHALSALPKATPVASGEAPLRREHARADRDDRERLCPSSRCGAVAGAISARADDLPQWPARRPSPPGHFVPGAMAQMLDWFKRSSGPGSNAGIFEWYRQRAEELRRGETGKRRRVPPGIGRNNMLHLNVAADGTVEMPEGEAVSFLQAGWVRVDAGDAPAQQSGDPPTARPEPLSVTAERPSGGCNCAARAPTKRAAAARVKRQHLRNVGFPPVHRLSEPQDSEPRCAMERTRSRGRRASGKDRASHLIDRG